MSIQAITAALALRGFSASEKLLLIAWSNYADENFQCYPSNRRLCEDTGLSDRQIRRIAGDLSERGLIVRKERFRPDKSRSTDLVTLVCLKEKAPDTMTRGVGTPCQGGGDTMAEQNRSINHSGSKEPSSKPARGSRLPPDWVPSQADLSFAASQNMTRQETDLEAAKFRNHWIAKSGAGAVKLDWAATWRNWCLSGYGSRQAGKPSTGGHRPKPASMVDILIERRAAAASQPDLPDDGWLPTDSDGVFIRGPDGRQPF